ncbi:MAG: c-type cytochrome [Planctomycetota bacterium]|jgi:mono/diheme cytochrome c family protein
MDRLRAGKGLRDALGVVGLVWGVFIVAPAGVRAEVVVEVSQGGRVVDTHAAPTVGLFVQEGAPVSPFAESGGFTATWRAELDVPIRDRFVFRFEGTGRFKLEIDGDVELEVEGEDVVEETRSLRMSSGANTLVATYTSPESGAARARLLWKSSEFDFESIPPTALKPLASDRAALATGQRMRLGREAFAKYRCAKCHVDARFLNAGAMPELLADTPMLMGAGTRLKVGWVAEWLLDPRDTNHQSTMPRLLRGADTEADARDIAAWLASLPGAPLPEGLAAPAADDATKVKRGGRLFAALGCVGCHALDADNAGGERPRMSLAHVGRKYKPEGLTAFLMNPQRHYAWIRMPNFGLDADEAGVLASFLLSRSESAAAGQAVGDAARGGELAAQLGCATCHGLPIVNRLQAPVLADVIDGSLDGGCLASAADGVAPAFDFEAGEREALAALLRGGADSLERDTDVEFARRQVAELNCVACHPMNGQTSIWDVRVEEVAGLLPPKSGDEDAEIDQRRPDLTRVGSKLRTPWLRDTLAGTLKEKPRPWMAARMPGFGVRAAKMARGLTAGAGLDPDSTAATGADTALVDVGAKLIEKVGGFGCTDCHAVGDRPAQAVFEAQGVNLKWVSERLREGYYTRWMMNPTRYDRQTKMPRYADDDGYTPLVQYFQGEAAEQYRAIWHYLLAGREIEAPK